MPHSLVKACGAAHASPPGEGKTDFQRARADRRYNLCPFVELIRQYRIMGVVR